MNKVRVKSRFGRIYVISQASIIIIDIKSFRLLTAGVFSLYRHLSSFLAILIHEEDFFIGLITAGI